MDVVSQILESENEKNLESLKKLKVEKEIDVEIDEGTLLLSDCNTLKLNKKKSNLEEVIKSTARDNVQLLINKLWDLPTKCEEEVIVAELPKPKYILPRSRKVPKPKALTKWQQFAKDKGIKSKKKGKSKLKWDDVLQKWIPHFGFKRAEADKQKEWLVECGDDGTPKENPIEANKKAKNERKAKNELQRLRNIAKSKKINVPKVGLPSTEHFKDAKQISHGVKVAEVSTASMGQFNEVPKKVVLKKKNKVKKKKVGQLKPDKGTKKPKAGKGNRDFRTKSKGRKRR